MAWTTPRPAEREKLLEQWRGTPSVALVAPQTDDGRERVAMLETLDEPNANMVAVVAELVEALRKRGVAALGATLKLDDPLRERAWDAVVGVSDFEGGTLFAHRLNL